MQVAAFWSHYFLNKELTLRCFKFVQHKFSPDIKFQYVKFCNRKMWRSCKYCLSGEFETNDKLRGQTLAFNVVVVFKHINLPLFLTKKLIF